MSITVKGKYFRWELSLPNSPDHNLSQLNIFECLLKEWCCCFHMTFLFCPILLSTFFKKLKCHVLWEAFRSHPLTLILIPLVLVALCIIFVKALMILIFVLLSSVADIMSYSTLHGSPAPRTGLKKLNGWMDGMDGIGASPGSVWVKWVLPFHSESNGGRFIYRNVC